MDNTYREQRSEPEYKGLQAAIKLTQKTDIDLVINRLKQILGNTTELSFQIKQRADALFGERLEKEPSPTDEPEPYTVIELLASIDAKLNILRSEANRL